MYVLVWMGQGLKCITWKDSYMCMAFTKVLIVPFKGHSVLFGTTKCSRLRILGYEIISAKKLKMTVVAFNCYGYTKRFRPCCA